jgi:hypothetical protein
MAGAADAQISGGVERGNKFELLKSRDTVLYDVAFVSNPGTDFAVTFAAFDSIRLSELASTGFQLSLTDRIQFYASTTPNGEWDVLLCSGDLAEDVNGGIVPRLGASLLTLQQIDSATGNLSFVAPVTLNMTPEPSIAGLFAIVPMLARGRRR